MNRNIRKVAVLGSGIMGSSIACHFANAGCSVLLLDRAPHELTEEEKSQKLQLNDKQVQNRIVKTSFHRAVKFKPSPLFSKHFLSRIILGNLNGDIAKIEQCDWIIEAVVENLEVKKKLYEKVEQYRKPGSLITSNTSGIPIHLMAEGRHEEFKQNFCGVHFFNPPRYLKLLEIIPTPYTNPEIVDFLMQYGNLHLGKDTVLCKDTPAFIGNRIGVWSLLKVMESMRKGKLNVDEIDILTGTLIGRPKSATFRTSDLVGLDTLLKVAHNLYTSLPNDESRDLFKLPDEIKKMEEKGWLGEKTGQGFYKKTKNEKGKTSILTLDLDTLEYQPKQKIRFESITMAKTKENLKERIGLLLMARDKVGEFYRDVFYGLFQYASYRIPEISDDLFSIDRAVCAGFGWELGPFETWDALGVEHSIKEMEMRGCKPNLWVYDMLKTGHNSFYQTQKGQKTYYDSSSQSYKPVPGTENLIFLEHRSDQVVWHNAESKITDIGDGVLNFSWNSKGYTLGLTVIEGLNKAISLAEKEYRGLVVGHHGSDFSLGANLGMIFMYAIEQDYDEIDFMVRSFQQTVMRVRHSSVPVVVAPRGRTLGGGCEITMHADVAQAAAETYIGLVEVGVGLIPGGGGTKELTKRVSESLQEGDVELNALQNAFMNIATAKVSRSAEEAKEMHILCSTDRITMNTNRQITEAKTCVQRLADKGYTQPLKATNIKVQGRTGIALFAAGINGMQRGRYISEYDAKIAMKIANVMCGGDLTQPQEVHEQYLLDLEREAFISLCGEKKTLERIQSVLQTGRPVRN